ncbi:ADP-ribosylation factor-like protein 2-binding protein isoform X1 [Pyxicephalus adspersus]
MKVCSRSQVSLLHQQPLFTFTSHTWQLPCTGLLPSADHFPCWVDGLNKYKMDDLEEENFSLSVSSPKDAEFDCVVGHLEDIIMDEEFQVLQRNFMEKYYKEFEDTEENKLSYTPIFNEYICLVEKYIEDQLLERIPAFNMSAFISSLQSHQQEIAGDIFDILLTFTDFLAFKEMFLDYKAEKEGRGIDLSAGLVVTPLFSSSLSST